MGPYYERDGITIYHGDCRDVLPTIVKVDLVLTDPPYGVNLRRKTPSRMNKIGGLVYGDNVPFDPAHVLQLGCPTILWGGNAYASRLPDSTGWLVWDKTHCEQCEHSQAELAWTNAVRGIRIHREAYHGFMRKRDGWFHPTQKPPGLMMWCLSFVPSARLIVDPYMGSGTTLIAAKLRGCIAIGIEIEERYCEIAARRLAQGVLAFNS